MTSAHLRVAGLAALMSFAGGACSDTSDPAEPQPPTLSGFSSLAKRFGDPPFTLSPPGSPSQGAFSYQSSDATVATITGATVTILGAGNATITVTQAPHGAYTSGTATATLTVDRATLTLTGFPDLERVYEDPPFDLTPPPSPSAGAFTFASDNPLVAEITGGTVTIVGAGLATITATQASTTNHEGSSITATLTVAKAEPTFGAFDRIVRSRRHVPFAIPLPTSTSDGTITVTVSDAAIAMTDGDLIHVQGVGTTTVTASQAESANYLAADVTTALNVLATSSLVTGFNYSCAIADDNRAYCWGGGNHGELGTGASGEVVRPEPTAVASDREWASLSAGADHHTCGITTNGEAHCWGGGSFGQLGNGLTSADPNYHEPAPVPVVGGLTFAAIAAGAGHSCAITTIGDTYCWGSGHEGQLGTGTNVGNVPTPQRVATELHFVAIAAGWDISCGLTTVGEAYCWGQRVGDGTEVIRRAPVRGAGGLLLQSVSPGSTSCGVTLDGAGVCWGSGSGGKLGNGVMGGGGYQELDVVSVLGGLAFRRISTAIQGVCGITTTAAAYCWGAGQQGQLGNGGTEPSAEPVPVAGGHQFTQVSGGNSTWCGQTSSGTVYCWGGTGAALGMGPGTGEDQTTPVLVVGGITWRQP